MAVGNICVASDAGGIPDMIQDGVNGFLFPADNAPALAEKLATVMKMPGALLESIHLRNRAFAEMTYCPESVAEQTVAAYRTLIQRSSSL
jgi:glycosyltransferase involved in cell wall biosynthesis